MPQGYQESSKNFASYVNSDLFNATVVSCDPGTLCIQVQPDGEAGSKTLQAFPLAATYSAALGFVETILPGIGTKVLCQGKSGDSTILIGMIPNIEPQGDESTAVLANRVIHGVKEPLLDKVHKYGYAEHITKTAVFNNNLPTDVTQGEKVIANEFGVMMGLFKLMANLRASELAQVQCHFLDDLVRIISHNFQHYTSLGELKVFHDGQGVHMEVGATHDPKESIGISKNSGISKLEQGKETDFLRFYKMSNEQLNMLERMKLFVGKLGEFVNFLILKPADTEHKLDGSIPSKPDTGLLQIKASLDGTLVVRSVSGIYLEKTNWIRVPQRIRTPEDPVGDDPSSTDFEYPDKAAYEFNGDYLSEDAARSDTAFLYYLQLRDYLAYINEEIGYANFKAHEEDFYVNGDKANETVLETIEHVDPLTGSSFKRTKSWIALMNNGGISISDTWGSAINMEGGNIYIQPAKDLIIQPNRNLIAKVGGNVSIAAKKELDISSTDGGLRIKTDLAQYLYSESSGIVLHGDGYELSESTVPYPDTKAIANVSGVVIKAPNASFGVNASLINLQAKVSVITQSRDITMHSTAMSRLMSDGQSYISAPNTGVLSTQQTINYSSGVNISYGKSQTLAGLKGQTIADVPFMGGRIPVEGLIDINDPNSTFAKDVQALADQVNTFDAKELLLSFKTQEDFDTVKFQFLPSSMYSLGDSDVIPQTLSQQSDTIISGSLTSWVESSVNNSYPYPGADKAQSFITVKCSNISDIDLANKAVDLISSSNEAFEVKNIFTQYKSL